MSERVDFYVLEHGLARQRDTLACRLTEKAYLQSLRVLVMAGDDEAAARFDELLWKFDERSFVPHDRLGVDARTAVQIGTHIPPTAGAAPAFDLVLNWGDHEAGALLAFPRIVEIIDDDADRKVARRERFKFYRAQELDLQTHRIDA